VSRYIVVNNAGEIIEEGGDHVPMTAQPMLPYEVIAVLNAVLGLWTLQDAANAIGRMPEDLIAEAQAWAAAGGNP
jgi:hypothetical protein